MFSSSYDSSQMSLDLVWRQHHLKNLSYGGNKQPLRKVSHLMGNATAKNKARTKRGRLINAKEAAF